MKCYKFFCTGLLCLSYISIFCQVNPNSTSECSNVLNFISSMSNNCELVYGQNLGSGNEANTLFTPYVENLQQETGEWLGLIGGDYGGWNSVNFEQMNEVFIDYWNDNRLVTLSWHPRNPWTGNDSWDTTNQGEFAQLMNPGNSVYNEFNAELSEIADALEELRDAGVVVLWRPWHEANGDWFWWGHPSGSSSNQAYIDFWIYTFNYFTYERGLNNLLWVFNSAESWNNATDFCYPGDEYVDMVSLDIYQDNMDWTNSADYTNLINTGKPFALGEYGPSINNPEGDYDFNVVHNWIKNNYPEVTYVLVWHSWSGHDNAFIDNLNAEEVLSDPCVINERENISNPEVDAITDVNAPAQVSPDETVQVSIAYEASTSRDIILVFQLDDSPWTVYNIVTSTIQAGQDILNVDIEIPANAPLGDGLYQMQAILAPLGGGWDNRLDNMSQANMDCIIEQFEDKLESVQAPSSVYHDEVIDVDIAYEAAGSRDIIIVFQDNTDPWNVYAEKTVRVEEGVGNLQTELPIANDMEVGNDLYQIGVTLAPVGGGWDNRYDDISQNNIDCLGPQFNDELFSLSAPDQLIQGQSISVAVACEASTARELDVILQLNESPWTIYSNETITILQGNQNIEFNLNVPSDLPIANDRYKIAAVLKPIGGDWESRLDDISKIDIDCITPYEDLILDLVSPLEVSPGEEVFIEIEYEASSSRDIHVVFQQDDSPWTFYAEEIFSVNQGSANQGINFTIPENVPIELDAYKFAAFIAPTNQAWEERLDEVQILDIDCIEDQNRTTSTHNTDISNVQAYPNPTDGLIQLTGIESFEMLMLYNTQGQLMIKKIVLSDNMKLDLSDLLEGYYFLSLIGDNKQDQIKIALFK